MDNSVKPPKKKHTRRFAQFLWRIYDRPARPVPWTSGGNLPWSDSTFSARMLREHLDESHAAASRPAAERDLQLDWLWSRLSLSPGSRVLDLTCGPGLYAVELAGRGCEVTGIDFSPAAIAYARELAAARGVAGSCRFIEADVRAIDFGEAAYDTVLFIYGQLAVFRREEACTLLARVAQALRPGGLLVIELLNQERIDKKQSSWWHTEHAGLWGDAPFLCLGERRWYESEALSLERFYIIHLESGRMDEIALCDQSYGVDEMRQLLSVAGFSSTLVELNWAGVPLHDAEQWVVYLAEK